MTKKQPNLPKNSYFIDSHCHLDMTNYGDKLADVLHHAQKNRVKKIITIGIDIQSSRAAVKLAQKYQEIFPSIGIHPHDVANITEKTYEEIRLLFRQHKEIIAGYGEIGLDYAKMYSEKEIQKDHFAKQLNLAHEFQLPIIIHCRDAQNDLLEILKTHAPFEHGGVIHCFSGDMEFAQQVLALGFYISIPGIVTFKNANELKEVAAKIPLTKMLIETDGPFLAPVPFRGKRNEPAYIAYTAEHIAQLRGVSIDEIAQATSQNAETLFSI